LISTPFNFAPNPFVKIIEKKWYYRSNS